ncbi:MAG: PAS domain-containing sensor histidine kinase [Promethearchaeota archaeon]|nr:MAG: PAS domain-containing sensor histidine kinase [Candidatus Lokiarchaeota archaeon]
MIKDDLNCHKFTNFSIKSEDIRNLILENTNELIAILNDKFEHEYINKTAYYNVLGYEENEILGKRPRDFSHPDDMKRIIDAIKHGLITGESTYEFRIQHKNEYYIWMETKGKYFKDGNGNFKTLFISRDIRERKKTEEKLKKSERLFRNIIENTKEAIVIIDLNGKLLYASPQLSKMLKERKISATSRFFFYIHKDDISKLVDFYKHTIKNREISDNLLEFRIKTKENNYIWVASTSKNYYDDSGKIVGFISTLKNITKRKLAEERLKESEEKYRNLYENSPNGIILLNEEGVILEANEAAGRIFGYNIPNVIGKNYRDLEIYTREELKKIEAQYQEYRSGTKPKPIELQLKRGDGTTAWISHQMSIIQSEENLLVETIAHDITEEKRAQKIIQEENIKLLELNKLKNDLVSRVSHELKTPLNSIYGGAQILLEIYKNSMRSEAIEFIEMIHKGGKRLKALIEKLLDISRIESGKMQLNLAEENLAGLIKECVGELSYLLKERDLNIELYLPDVAILRVDKIRIEQVITNLLSNAIKNTPPEGNIIISLYEKNDSFYFSITDSGIGLTTEDMEKLFKKFGKIERYGQDLNVDIEGSGLGLYLSKEVIDLHGGSIWVESEGRNKGSIFKIRFNKN